MLFGETGSEELSISTAPAPTRWLAASFVWWREIPELAGFYGAADTLVSLRAQVHEALDDLGHDVTGIVELLAPARRNRTRGIATRRPDRHRVAPCAW